MPLFHLKNPFLCSIMHGHAGVMELVDVLDSKSSAARRAGSSPATGTRVIKRKTVETLDFQWFFSFFVFLFSCFGIYLIIARKSVNQVPL